MGMKLIGCAMSLLTLSAALVSGRCEAQVIMERNVSLQMAKTIAEGALEECTKNGHKVVVVVVDRAGQMVVLLRSDGVNPHNLELARRKAYTARTFRQTTEEFFVRSEKHPAMGSEHSPMSSGAVAGGLRSRLETKPLVVLALVVHLAERQIVLVHRRVSLARLECDKTTGLSIL